MKTFTPGFSGIAVCIALALAGCGSVSTQPESQITSIDDTTYKIVREAGTGFTRDAKKLEQEARAEAEKFCEERGKRMKTISVSQNRPIYTMGFASAQIIFQALDPDDPAPTSPSTALTTAGGTSTASGEVATTPTDDIYAELMKLDELRQRGILTDKEFRAEKKKILKRSR